MFGEKNTVKHGGGRHGLGMFCCILARTAWQKLLHVIVQDWSAFTRNFYLQLLQQKGITPDNQSKDSHTFATYRYVTLGKWQIKYFSLTCLIWFPLSLHNSAVIYRKKIKGKLGNSWRRWRDFGKSIHIHIYIYIYTVCIYNCLVLDLTTLNAMGYHCGNPYGSCAFSKISSSPPAFL